MPSALFLRCFALVLIFMMVMLGFHSLALIFFYQYLSRYFADLHRCIKHFISEVWKEEECINLRVKLKMCSPQTLGTLCAP